VLQYGSELPSKGAGGRKIYKKCRELQTDQFNISGLQTNGACFIRLSKANLGNERVVIRGPTWLQTRVFVRKSVTVCKDIADSLDEEAWTDALIIDFPKAF
jgi:hypothetical protein